MIKLIAAATFVLAFAVPAEAVPRAPLHQPDSMITQVREGCGLGRYRVNGVCVTRRYGYYGNGYRRYGYYGGGYGVRRYGYYGYRPYRYYGGGIARRAYWRGRGFGRWR